MNAKLLIVHHLWFLSLKEGCKGLSEPTLVKIPHCWKSHFAAQFNNLTKVTIFQGYLKKYGYLEHHGNVAYDVMKRAITNFQNMAGITPTGTC